MKRLPALLAALVGLTASLPAQAALGPPFTLQLAGPPSYARPNVPFSGVMVVTADTISSSYWPLTLSQVQLAGDGWTTLFLGAPPVIQLDPGEVVNIPFTVISPEPINPIDMSLFVEANGGQQGLSFRRPINLTLQHYLWRTEESPLIQSDSCEISPAAPRELAPLGSGRDIRVYGRFGYVRGDGEYVGVDRCEVKVVDDDWLNTALIEGYTDEYGYFDLTFHWDPGLTLDQDPDILVKFKLKNENIKASILDADPTTSKTFKTVTHWNVTGSSLHLTALRPSDEDLFPMLHLFSTGQHIWRWFNNKAGFDTPKVTIVWPYLADATCFYSTMTSSIYVGEASQWSEPTLCREYGHHWLESFAFQPDVPDYWNGTCDGGWPSAGHCPWCEENETVALTEGFGRWIAGIIPAIFEERYGTSPYEPAEELEDLQDCEDTLGTPCSCNPYETEGYFSAFLWDVYDSDKDWHVTSDIRDESAAGFDEILATFDEEEPQTVSQFLVGLKNRLSGNCDNLWETASNCGYDIDFSDPSLAYLHSTSHAIGAAAADPTIGFQWHPADDCAGVWDYSYVLSLGAAASPDESVDFSMGPANTSPHSFTTDVLAPGTYYFNLRPIDRAGNAGSVYSSGPYIIDYPIGADLLPQDRSGWDAVLVPRNTADAGAGGATIPTHLDTLSVYWNMSYRNEGANDTGTNFRLRLTIDGEQKDNITVMPLAGLTNRVAINRGPVATGPGRRTVGCRLDGQDQVAEDDETDNEWAHQWVFTPPTLDPEAVHQRSAPPDKWGGWEWIVDGSIPQYNCDGIRIDATPEWNAAVIYSTDLSVDYDCRLHFLSTSATDPDAFANIRAWSAREEGCTDAVIVNQRLYSETRSDVGVVNWNDGGAPYRVQHVTSTSAILPNTVEVTFLDSEMLKLVDVFCGALYAGSVSVRVSVDPAEGPFQVAWIGKDVPSAALDDLDVVTTDESGQALLLIDTPGTGFHAVVVFRDPRDLPAGAPGPSVDPASASLPSALAADSVVVTIELDGNAPRLHVPSPSHLTNWYGPILPDPFQNGVPSMVMKPDTLMGGVPNTYLNAATRNDASVTGVVEFSIRVDGVEVAVPSVPYGGPGNIIVNNVGPITVPGGRHTLSYRAEDPMRPDPDSTGNAAGMQFVWSPAPLLPGAAQLFPPPPPTIGEIGGPWDWDWFTNREWFTNEDEVPYFYFNCTGLRLPVGPSVWRGVAVAPADTAGDIDVRLHEARPGAIDGFATSLAFSGWPDQSTDFVLVNTRLTSSRPFDVGVLRSSCGAAPPSFRAQNVGSVYIGPPTLPGYGPIGLDAGEFVELREFLFAPGSYNISVANLAGVIDWGLTVLRNDIPFVSKSQAVAGGLANEHGPGLDELVTVTIPDSGYYCVAVWKSTGSELNSSGSCMINISPAAGSVPGDPIDQRPAALLSPVHPNPSRGGVRIPFTLPSAGPIRLEVFDSQGRHVRTLRDDSMGAGAGEAYWDGSDGRGGRLPSGLYHVRLETKGGRESRKILLID